MNPEEEKTLIIYLTNRAPIKIVKENWPVISSASYKDWDTQHECQANRKWKAWLTVRQHIDGRTIVHCVYEYTTRFQHEQNVCYRGGELLTPSESEYPVANRDENHNWTSERVIAAIKSVGKDLGLSGGCENADRLVCECIADLPVEEIT